MNTTDISCSQSTRSNRSTHNGRFRSRRTSPLLPSLRDLPSFLWESPLRVHLWPRTIRQRLSTHNTLPYVTSLRRYIIRSITSHTRLVTPFLDFDLYPKCIRVRILPITTGIDKPGGRCPTYGWHAGVCVDELGNCVVHI